MTSVYRHLKKHPSARPADMPCGSCAAGTYDPVPFMVGVEMFKHCKSRKQALSEAPRCKKEPAHICFGARDFIVSGEFPMTEDYLADPFRESVR